MSFSWLSVENQDAEDERIRDELRRQGDFTHPFVPQDEDEDDDK